MSPHQVNVVNIGLMLLSAAVAMAVPFETFLFAYAVLGPLHYLTQISWLHDRAYFTAGRREWLPLVGLALLITATQLLVTNGPEWAYLGPYSLDLMFLGLGLSLLLVVTADAALRTTGMVVLAVLTFLLHGSSSEAVWLGIYLPTLIHVFVFTAAFVLYGAIKSRSVSAYASLAVFFACGGAVLFLDPGTLGYRASDYAGQAYRSFTGMHMSLLGHTGLAATIAPTGPANSQFFPFGTYGELFTSASSLQVGRFIAFAYTYHYLNWFSKTSIIRWHEVPKRRMVAMLLVWLASLGLYAADYAVGIRWLLFLSYLHVLLEFPLDHKTFVAIGRGLIGRR